MNGDSNDTSALGQHGQLSHNGPKRCKEGHELPAWGSDRCQTCMDDYAKESDKQRLALIERDVVSREAAGSMEITKHIAWLDHTKDWKEINAGLVKAADRQADALEAIAEQLRSIARRPT